MRLRMGGKMTKQEFEKLVKRGADARVNLEGLAGLHAESAADLDDASEVIRDLLLELQNQHELLGGYK